MDCQQGLEGRQLITQQSTKKIKIVQIEFRKPIHPHPKNQSGSKNR